ncbi:MAG TPA: hypothetical protein VF581_10940 [Flavobacterium sp.]
MSRLALNKFASLEAVQKEFHNDDLCIHYLESLRWPKTVTSPFEPTSKVYKCSNSNYRCKSSGKYFNVKTNTLFHNTKIPLQKWFLAIWILSHAEKKISSVSLGKQLDVTQRSAWLMIQRIKLNDDWAKPLVTKDKVARKSAVKVVEEKSAIEFDSRLPMTEWLTLLRNRS